jgi:hypothetical protein
MTDDWDFYFCLVGDKPASIFVDLGAAREAPTAAYRFMGFVRVRLRDPMPDGLATEAESTALSLVEDRLEEQLTAAGAAVYVGRSTGNGTRDFYFYTKDDSDWQARVDVAMAPFPEYACDAGARFDEEWAAYFKFLRPSGMSLQTILNRRQCQALEQQGDTLTTPREVDHLVQLPTRESSSNFRLRAARLGFSLRRDPTAQQGRTEIDVHVFRVDTPSLQNIDEITLPLCKIASDLGGRYVGWECTVVENRR